MTMKFVTPLVLCAAVSLCTGVSRGDTPPKANTAPTEVQREKQTPLTERQTYHVIKLTNVRPGMMAWWLDPGHNPMPLEYQTNETRVGSAYGQFRNPYEKKSALEPSSPGAPKTGSDVFSVPEGVDRIIAVDSQNVLLVYGTEEGARKIESLVKHLDRPIQQVQLEVRFVEVSAGAVKKLGINSNSSRGPFATNSDEHSSFSGTFTIGFVPQQFYSAFDNLVKQGLARQLGAGTVNTPNNLPANFSLHSYMEGPSDNKIPIPVDIDTKLTPTINADGTITVLFKPELNWQVNGGKSNAFVQTFATVKDGDTVALGGLITKKDMRLLIFVKASVLQPAAGAENQKAVP